MLYSDQELEDIWNASKEKYKIQQIKEEWFAAINATCNQWDKKGNILEIGCYDGGSSWFLNQFAERMVTIDNNDPPRFDPSEFPGDYSLIVGDSHDVLILRALQTVSWDLVFIDGDHSYEGIRADYLNIVHMLPKTGHTAVLFHDIVISDYHHQHGCYVGEFYWGLPNRCQEFSVDETWGGIGLVWI